MADRDPDRLVDDHEAREARRAQLEREDPRTAADYYDEERP